MTEREMCNVLLEKGYGIIPPDRYLIDFDPGFLPIWNKVKDYTMTSPERGYALYKAVEYICKNKIPGDFVECGVWKGGSCMLAALALKEFSNESRDIYLYDTFSGMTEPTDEDIIAWNDRKVKDKWEEDQKGIKDNFGSWAIALEEVKNNIKKTGYPFEKLKFIKGDIIQTLNETVPSQIALLRLDTDWYKSTVKELDVLYPLLSTKGALIIDDYGHFKGARKAVDEYFKGRVDFPYLNRIDYTGRVTIKQR